MKDHPPDGSNHEPPDHVGRGVNRASKLVSAFAVLATAAVASASSSGLRGYDGSGLGSRGIRNNAHTADALFPRDNDREPRFLQDADPFECDIVCCRDYEDDICQTESDNEWVNVLPFWFQIFLIVLLLSLSALFSGLTLGLMSLDKTGLEIVMSGDDERSAHFAKVIYPVREDGNLLLCTLLLGNVAVNSMLAILLAEYAGGITGFLISTFAIVIFGEIVPQALCSRYALRIGSATVPLVKVIRAILYIIAKPLAWCLDKSLGRELASTYSTTEMLKLVQIHMQENVIDQDTAGAMTGALTYKNMTVKEVMTPLERTFMLNVDEKLSFETIAKIFRTGYSRIPVYEISPNNVIGLLFVKDLIFIDPEDATPLRSFIQIFGRGVHVVWPDDKLGDVLNELKRGRSHLALVRDVNNEDESKDPFYEMKGIITLEDIIEKILGHTIVDETDAYVDSTQSVRVNRAESFEWARLRLLDSKIVDELLSQHEAKAVAAHLRVNYSKAVELLTDTQLFRLVADTPVQNVPTATHKLGEELPSDLLYEKNVPSQTCTLILGGKVTVMVGSENFRSDVSSWSLLGVAALSNPSYSPDFTAFVSDGPCRCLQITHEAFSHAVDASALERNVSDGIIRSSTPQGSTASIDASQLTSVTGQELKTSRHASRRQKLLKAFALNKNDGRRESATDKETKGDSRNGSGKVTESKDGKTGHVYGVEKARKPVAFQEGGLFEQQSNSKEMSRPKTSNGSNGNKELPQNDPVVRFVDEGRSTSPEAEPPRPTLNGMNGNAAAVTGYEDSASNSTSSSRNDRDDDAGRGTSTDDGV